MLRVFIGAVTLLALCACQTTGTTKLSDLRPGQRPALDSDEAGLWLISDKVEQQIHRSGRVVRDPALNAYVQRIICQLAAEHCADIRVQIIRNAGFNASMAPNGHMQVWTGLLLRAENEAQLAFVLGHEVGHYLKRHSVKRWRDLRNSTNASAFFQVITAAAGVGIIGQLGHLIAAGSVYSFSRDQEREADDLGFELLANASYDPHQAPAIWEGLLAERDAEKHPERSIFFASHPSPEERTGLLRARADRFAAPATVGRIAVETHRDAIAPHRIAWFADELPRREFAAALILLDRLEKSGSDGALVKFYRGEIYRIRAAPGDDQQALSAYREAIDAGGAPAQLHRSRALVLWRSGDRATARDAFVAYLQQQPDADDRQMISSYIEQLAE